MLDFFILRLADFLNLLILVRVVISFVPDWKNSTVSHTVETITEPILGPLRDLLPTQKIGIDLSPILALILIRLAARLLTAIL